MFINEYNSHFTSQFYKVDLGPITILKMVSRPSLKSVGSPNIKFLLSIHPPFILTPLDVVLKTRNGVFHLFYISCNHYIKLGNKLLFS